MFLHIKEFVQTALAIIRLYRLKRLGVFNTDKVVYIQEDRNFERYFAQMQEIAKRFLAIRRILASKRTVLTEEDFDNEFLWLQLRMIIELATFGAVAADEQRYAMYRQTVNKKHYTADGKVNKILHSLKAVSPDYFLPIPLVDNVVVEDSGVVKLNADALVYADVDRLIEVHNRAGEHLHSRNPLSAEQRGKTLNMMRESRETFLEDHAYIWSILKFHMKACLIFDENTCLPTERSEPNLFWFVYFDETKKGIDVMMHRGNPSSAIAPKTDEAL